MILFPTHRLIVSALNYRVGRRDLIHNVDFEINPGQCLQVTGPNGVGKSTLLRIVAGLANPDSGEQSLAIENQSILSKQVPHRMLYQGHLYGFKDQFTVIENLQFQCALDTSGYQSSLNLGEQHDLILAALQTVGLKSRSSLAFGKLSAGQKRRCVLARLAWNNETDSVIKPLWLLDEPLTALDDQAQALFVSILARHLAKGGSAMIATHQDLQGLGLAKPIELRLSPITV